MHGHYYDIVFQPDDSCIIVQCLDNGRITCPWKSADSTMIDWNSCVFLFLYYIHHLPFIIGHCSFEIHCSSITFHSDHVIKGGKCWVIPNMHGHYYDIVFQQDDSCIIVQCLDITKIGKHKNFNQKLINHCAISWFSWTCDSTIKMVENRKTQEFQYLKRIMAYCKWEVVDILQKQENTRISIKS
jgi:hypothetical protein